VDGKYTDPQKAIEYLTNAIKLQPNIAVVYINRGDAHFSNGNKKFGCLDAQQACDLGDCELLERSKSKGYCR
jgi:predicted Zn-dependent protease